MFLDLAVLYLCALGLVSLLMAFDIMEASREIVLASALILLVVQVMQVFVRVYQKKTERDDYLKFKIRELFND